MRRPGLFFRLLLPFLLLALPAWAAASSSAATDDTASIHKPEKPKISPQEAQELFEHLDAVLQFVSDDTKYPIVHAVKRELAGRDSVQQNIENNLKNDQDAQRLERSGMVLQKFGLIPHGFDLHAYMVKLLREQVAGYYSLPDKTVYMMNWVSEQEQMPIMAHELTHALQDQQVDLVKWLRGEPSAVSHQPSGRSAASGQWPVARTATSTSNPPSNPTSNSNANAAQIKGISEKSIASDPETADEKEIRQDEEQAARQALVEGQGMVVMVDYLLRGTGQNFLNAPFVVQSLRAAMTEGSNYPVYKNAPLYLRESLSFPYYYGMDFIEALLLKGGKRMAYAGALKNPPEDTRQIMQPQAYLKHEVEELVQVPDVTAVLGQRYSKYDVGSVGEFDVMVLLKQFAGESAASKLSPEWRGGAYWAYKITGDSTADGGRPAATTNSAAQPAQPAPLSTNHLALLYLSRWSSAAAAQRFATEYAAMIPKRYPQATQTTDTSADGSRWMTDEGPVIVVTNGDEVLALESFDIATAKQLQAKIFGEPIPAHRMAAASAR